MITILKTSNLFIIMYLRTVIILSCWKEYPFQSSDGDSVAEVDNKSIENSSSLLHANSDTLINFGTLKLLFSQKPLILLFHEFSFLYLKW